MTEKGHDGGTMPFGIPMPEGIEVMAGEGTLESIAAMVRIMQNLPLFAGCHADLIDYVKETGQVGKFRDFLKGRLCDKHREMAPETIFNDVPEVLDLFQGQLEDYLETLNLERCHDHDEH